MISLDIAQLPLLVQAETEAVGERSSQDAWPDFPEDDAPPPPCRRPGAGTRAPGYIPSPPSTRNLRKTGCRLSAKDWTSLDSCSPRLRTRAGGRYRTRTCDNRCVRPALYH